MSHFTKIQIQILDKMLKMRKETDLILTNLSFSSNIIYIIKLINKVFNKIIKKEEEFQDGRKNEDRGYAWNWKNGI